MQDNLEYAKRDVTYNIKQVEEWYDLVIYRLEREIEEVKRYKERFEEACEGRNTTSSNISLPNPNDVVEWTVADLTSLTNNLQYCNAMMYSTRLMVAKEAVRRLEQDDC